MASGKNPSDFFVVDDGGGSMDRQPPMTIKVTDGEIAYYARGRDVGVFPETTYKGIGKYVLSVDKAGARQQIDALKTALSSRSFTGPLTRGGAVFDFSFEKDGRHYEGKYDYQPGEAFNSRLDPFYEIADKVLKDGHPDIKLHPVFAAHPGKEGFVVDLTFRNEGQEAVSIAGPDTWTPDLNRPDLRNVEIGAINQAGTSFHVRLTSRYLSEASRGYASTIAVKPGEAATLTFEVPYSDVTFGSTSSSRRITSGSYRFTGRMSIDLLAPAELHGNVRTPMNDVQPVELQAQ
nr:hypothetical protein HUO10_002391 [Paraburkholderia busanensis]